MIGNFAHLSNWLAANRRNFQRLRHYWSAPPLQRPNIAQLAKQSDQLPAFVRDCAVAQKYLHLLAPLDWDNFPQRDPQRAWPGSTPLSRAPFVAAYLVKLNEQHRYMSDLRRYLLEHPALVWLLGFDLQPCPESCWGFDVPRSLPDTRLFLTVLRTLDNAVIQFLLDSTVHTIRQELPDPLEFGKIIALDTKHIIAWVKENNPKTFIKKGRYDKTCQPIADRDCKLGVKKRSNQKKAAPLPASIPTPTRQAQPARHHAVTQLFWGYGSGIVTTKVAGWGEFVLAELTLTFNRPDLAYFFPLMEATERRLGFRPKFAALDAAFDTFYVYDFFDQVGGFAAVPFAKRGSPVPRKFDPDGLPLCQANLPMPLKGTYTNRRGLFPAQYARYACPLLFPEPNGQTCPIDHKRWPKGGCIFTQANSLGARIRHQLDRDSEAFKQVYNHRTAAERINALAVNLGIERPKFRNQASIANMNSLIYVLLNLRAIARIRRLKQRSLTASANRSESQ